MDFAHIEQASRALSRHRLYQREVGAEPAAEDGEEDGADWAGEEDWLGTQETLGRSQGGDTWAGSAGLQVSCKCNTKQLNWHFYQSVR